ncbi:MAG TPA: type II toxin-antitoxin system HicA family toxin [Candidatus Paceibacterota bacterium]
MPRLRVLSGQEVIQAFERLGFSVIKQKGSHIKLQRITLNGKETLTVPLHDELDKGTLRGIYNQARRFVSEKELQPYFYET